MAIYHFSAQIINRNCKKFGGRSIVACAAYRAGERLKDERCNTVFDYSRRKGVEYAEILLPEGAPKWLSDREELWNEVERKEKRKDSQLARELNVALPHELSPEERKAFLLDYVQEQFVDKGMVADVAIHSPVKEHGDHRHNHHAHIMLTMRQAHKAGLYRTKTREWNSRDMLRNWRKEWENHQNRALERAGRTERVDHKTLTQQRIEALERGDTERAEELKRTPEIHVGVRARQMERRQKKARPTPDYSKQIMQHMKIEARKAANAQRALKEEAYQQRMRKTDKNLKVQHSFDGRKQSKNGYSWTKEYKNFMQQRIGHNAKIIAYNQAQAEQHKEQLQIRQVRFQQKQLYYSRQKHKPHAQKRLGLLGLLLGDIADALMQAAGAESRRSGRFLDYGNRFLSPAPLKNFDMDRGRGGGRERFLQ